MNKDFWNRFVTGDLSALKELYEQYASILYAYGMKIAPDRQLIDDCIQDLFLYIYDKRKTISNPPNMKAYLFLSLKRKIYYQISVSSKKQAKSVQLDTSNSDQFNLTIDVQETLENAEFDEAKLIALQKAINNLSPRQREVIYLRYYQKMDVPQVAEIMEVSKQTAMNMTTTAIAKLRASDLLTAFCAIGLCMFLVFR